MIAAWAGCDNVIPMCFSTHVSGNDVIDGQIALTAPAVLTGVIVSSEDFFPRKLYNWPGSLNHPGQADH